MFLGLFLITSCASLAHGVTSLGKCPDIRNGYLDLPNKTFLSEILLGVPLTERNSYLFWGVYFNHSKKITLIKEQTNRLTILNIYEDYLYTIKIPLISGDQEWYFAIGDIGVPPEKKGEHFCIHKLNENLKIWYHQDLLYIYTCEEFTHPRDQHDEALIVVSNYETEIYENEIVSRKNESLIDKYKKILNFTSKMFPGDLLKAVEMQAEQLDAFAMNMRFEYNPLLGDCPPPTVDVVVRGKKKAWPLAVLMIPLSCVAMMVMCCINQLMINRENRIDD